MPFVDKWLKKVPQYTRNARHFRAVVGHGTPTKWLNLARTEIERKRRKIHVQGRPYLLIIDPCNYCNLRCPLCATGNGSLGRTQAMMSLECFKQYFDPMAPYLFEAYMHNWGESLMNKEVYKMIAHAQASNVGTNLSTNFSETTERDLEQLLDSGLEYLIVSLDGTSAESYLKYRVRGKFDNVISNLQKIIELREKRNLKRPVVEWQFIVMKQNEHEIPEAERLAKEFGVDLLRFIPVGLPYATNAEERQAYADEWFPLTVEGREHAPEGVEQQFGQANKPSPCFYLYRSMVVNPDGGVSPCCVVNHQDKDFGRLPTADIGAFWNNPNYVTARSLFSPDNASNPVSTVCDGCDIFGQWNKDHTRKDTRPAPTDLVQIR